MRCGGELLANLGHRRCLGVIRLMSLRHGSCQVEHGNGDGSKDGSDYSHREKRKKRIDRSVPTRGWRQTEAQLCRNQGMAESQRRPARQIALSAAAVVEPGEEVVDGSRMRRARIGATTR